jgi:hypothetical protein
LDAAGPGDERTGWARAPVAWTPGRLDCRNDQRHRAGAVESKVGTVEAIAAALDVSMAEVARITTKFGD